MPPFTLWLAPPPRRIITDGAQRPQSAVAPAHSAEQQAPAPRAAAAWLLGFDHVLGLGYQLENFGYVC